jgi:hypothetical protein
VRIGVLEGVFDLSPAAWVRERLTTFGVNVASVIPEGFERYGRILHPARRDGRPVSWSEVAAHNSRAVHPEMQWHAISGLPPGEPGAPWDEGPMAGSIPEDLTGVLVEHLRSHTTTPGSVWFAVWTGWGAHRLAPRPGTRASGGVQALPDRDEPLPPAFELPAREYWLLHGPIEGALETMSSRGWQSVNLWWPEDRAWFVSTEIDFAWTYVGGTRELIDGLMADPRLEVLHASLTDGVAFDADRVNGSDPEDQ